MRKVLLLLAAIPLSYLSHGQDSTKFRKFYIEIGGGYNFPLVNDELKSPRSEVGTLDLLMRDDSTLSVKPVQGTLGQGWKTSLNVGYMFHRNIGFEFQFNFVRGEEILMSRIKTPTYQAEHHLLSQRVEVVPQLVLNHQIKRWGVYSKSGVILPLWGYIESSITASDQEGRVLTELIGFAAPDIDVTVDAKARTNPRFSYGFQTRLGLSFQPTSLITVYGEVSYAALSVRAKETITEYINIELRNRMTDQSTVLTMEDLDLIDLNSNYVDELTENSNNFEYNPNTDVTKPLDEPAFKDNFNHLGFSVGVRFNIR